MEGSIVNAVHIDPVKAATVARKNYVQLLRSEHVNNPETCDALSLSAHVLGLNPKQVNADVLIIRRVKQLEKLIAAQRTIESDAKLAEMKLKAWDEETAKIQAERAELLRKAVSQNSLLATNKLTEVKNAALEMEALKNSNPDLLG
jgi:hypothetical protein